MKKFLINIIITFLYVSVAFGGPEVTVNDQVKTINLFFEILSKKADLKISDLRDLYGMHGIEYEFGVLFGIVSEVKEETETTELSPEIGEFVSKNTPSQEGNSRWLKCIKYMNPNRFEDKVKTTIKLPPIFYGEYNDRKFYVLRGKEIWVFQFDSDEKIINHIKFPNGKTIYWLFNHCSKFKDIELDVHDIPK